MPASALPVVLCLQTRADVGIRPCEKGSGYLDGRAFAVASVDFVEEFFPGNR